MAEAAQPIIMISTPVRAFEVRECAVSAVAVFPDRRLMVTGLGDNTLCLWDLTNGVVLKKMEGHQTRVGAVAVSRDGRLIASGDANGKLIAWHGNTGELLSQVDVHPSSSFDFPLPEPLAIDSDAHSAWISSLDFSPGGALASGSGDKTTRLWSTETWKSQGKINCGASVHCVRHSPSGELLAIATDENIQIWTPSGRECIAEFKAHSAFDSSWNYSLTWTPDGTRLLSAGSATDPTVREWETSTWKQFGDPWKRHTGLVTSIAVDSTGTFVASASHDHHVYLWRLSDRRTIASFKHFDEVNSVTFSMDGKHVLSAGKDRMISEWAIPEDDLPDSKILDIDSTIRNACITCDWDTAEALLVQRIGIDENNYIAYANRSLVRARRLDWDQALNDALKSVSIQPSFIGCISKGIAYCGKKDVRNAMKAFDLAFMFTKEDPKIIHHLLLIKAIAYFNANQYDDAIQRVQELADTCPKVDILACHIVESYLRIQMGISALDGAYDNEDADHFTVVVNAIASISQSAIYSRYDDFVVLFGWDLKSLWKIASQKRCDGLLRARRLREAHESYRYMMDMCDEATKASCLDWSTAFKQDCSALYAADGDTVLASGDAALAVSDYNKAIELYSAAIDLDSATDEVFAKRGKAKLEKMLWADALLDAQQVIKLSPSSYLGYRLKHAALYGARRYDEAFEAFQVMLSKLDNSTDAQLRELRRQYASSSEAGAVISRIINDQLEHTPLRLINTSTGRLCDREAQINAFEASTEYRELLLFKMMHGERRIGDIKNAVVKYFGYVMLSHRWEGQEPLLHDIQDEGVYDLNPVGGIPKLQSFCRIARDQGYRWAWIDTCCIDRSNNVEVQQSVNSMFIWYHLSALTIIYLSDVPPSSQPGALAGSVWNARGWTVQEFLAPKFVLFYQKDWSLYLDDRSLNHKDSATIMQEMRDATGIDAQALVAFRPGMTNVREKLQWASTRLTTLPEDIAYSLFGIFGVRLPVIYGEKKQNALGRLLQEIVAKSRDITALDWVGKPSQFNSCLPADIMSYRAPPCGLTLSEYEIQAIASSLRVVVAEEVALELYSKLYNIHAPRFLHRRLQLPCIVFHVTDVRQRRGQDQETYFTYEVKADGLHDLLIATEETLIQSSRTTPTLQKFLLVRPWDCRLLELPDFSADAQSVDDWTPPPSPSPDLSCGSPVEQGSLALESSEREDPHFADDMHTVEDYVTPLQSPGEPVDSEFHRALRLIVRLQQPFCALLLAQLQSGEYKRIASDRNIIVQVEDVRAKMDIRILEIS